MCARAPICWLGGLCAVQVTSFVDRAKREGAKVLAGGGRPEGLDPKLAKGYYYAPTVSRVYVCLCVIPCVYLLCVCSRDWWCRCCCLLLPMLCCALLLWLLLWCCGARWYCVPTP